MSSHLCVQLLAAQDVEVQVMHSLTGIGSAIGHHPVAVAETFLLSDHGNDLKNVGDHSAVIPVDLRHRANMVLGDHQNVGGRLGGDVPKCQDSSS